MKRGGVQALLWPGGSGGTRRTHRPGGLGPRPVHEETRASGFQADCPNPQAMEALCLYAEPSSRASNHPSLKGYLSGELEIRGKEGRAGDNQHPHKGPMIGRVSQIVPRGFHRASPGVGRHCLILISLKNTQNECRGAMLRARYRARATCPYECLKC